MCFLTSWEALVVVVSQRTVESWPPQFLSCKEYACNARDGGNTGLIPGVGRSPGGEHENLLQYSCLKNFMDRGAWRATIQRVAKNQIQQRLSTAIAHGQLGRKFVITGLSNCSFIYSRPSTFNLSCEQMETDKIQEMFFSETLLFFFFSLSSVLVETWLFGALKSNFLFRKETKTYTNLRETQFAKYPN